MRMYYKEWWRFPWSLLCFYCLWYDHRTLSAQGIGGDTMMMGGESSVAIISSQQAAAGVAQAVDFKLPTNFYVGKCDPCIARSEYRIWVITHGTFQDEYWQQVEAVMQQASRDTGVAVQVQLHDGALPREEIYTQMAARIRQASTMTTTSNERPPNVLLTTLPLNSYVVHQAVSVALATGMPVFGFHTGHTIAAQIGVLGFVAQDQYLGGKMVAQEIIDVAVSRHDNNTNNTLHQDTKESQSSASAGTTKFVFNFEDNTTQVVEEEEEEHLLQSTNTPILQQQKRQSVMFVNPFQEDDDDATSGAYDIGTLRYEGLRQTLQHLHPEEIIKDSNNLLLSYSDVEMLKVDPNDLFETAQSIRDKVFFEVQGEGGETATSCPYDVVVLGSSDSRLVEITLSALEDLECSQQTTLVTFGISRQITQAIVQGKIAFTAAPQHYMESVFAVVMASMYITTGKKLSLPKESKIYMSGPILINQNTNLPTDSQQTCQEQAFPVCHDHDDDDDDGEELSVSTSSFVDPTIAISSSSAATLLCNKIGCLPRSKIRIGGALHGVTTDLFWNPVFAAARQAAVDVDVVLELEQLEPEQTQDIIHAKMAARIRNLCQSGVDGIFVSVPNDEVADAIRYCRSLNVPVISVNAGGDRVQELDILQHIGQHEYNAGYGAGKQLVKEGMKEGYCLNHAPGNVVLDERCSGFSDAIAEHPDVVYRGMVIVASDNQAQFTLQVETAVRERSENIEESWDGIAVLLGGASQMGAALHVLSLHPNVIVGSFDISDSMFVAFAEGKLRFGIDQQPFLQGSLPVFLLAYAAYTQQSLINDVIETGPRFVNEIPTSHEEQCENTYFSICSILPVEDFQMIGPGLLGVGYFFVGLTIVTALICLGWTWNYRLKSPLVRISQPPFLMTLCVGCIVSILSIIPMGAQTEYRYEKDSLVTGSLTLQENPDIGLVDASCMLVPWLYSLGFVMVFSSLFAKIWRVQLIFKAGETFRRRTVTFLDIAPCVVVMFVIVLALLVAWQILDPFRWEREATLVDHDGYALESIGTCTSDHGWYFLLSLLGFQILCLFYALVLCFQTKHIQDDLSESSNVFLAVICIFQVDVIALPITAMVQDDAGVFYFVRACALFLQNYTVLCLMFWPKMYRTFTGTDHLPSVSTMRSSAPNTLRSSGGNARHNTPIFNMSNNSQGTVSRVTFQLPEEGEEQSSRPTKRVSESSGCSDEIQRFHAGQSGDNGMGMEETEPLNPRKELHTHEKDAHPEMVVAGAAEDSRTDAMEYAPLPEEAPEQSDKEESVEFHDG